jgi:hypothetical protein
MQREPLPARLPGFPQMSDRRERPQKSARLSAMDRRPKQAVRKLNRIFKSLICNPISRLALLDQTRLSVFICGLAL